MNDHERRAMRQALEGVDTTGISGPRLESIADTVLGEFHRARRDSLLRSTIDAQVWATEFMAVADGTVVDTDMVRTWFANAIEQGRDAGKRMVPVAADADDADPPQPLDWSRIRAILGSQARQRQVRQRRSGQGHRPGGRRQRLHRPRGRPPGDRPVQVPRRSDTCRLHRRLRLVPGLRQPTTKEHTMKRFGIKAGLNGCGDVSTGACYACCVRALTKGRWMVRQILPLKYATHYFTNGNPSGVMGDANDQQFVNVSYWRMWMGRVFGHQTYRYEVKP